MDDRTHRMEGTANFYTFAYLRQASWNAFDTAKSASEGANYHRISAVLLSALTIEAHLNHVGESAVPDWLKIERKLSRNERLECVARQLKLTIDKSSRPVQTVIELFKFRDRLVHGKMHSEPSQYEAGPSDEGSLDPDWLRKYWSDDVVQRTLDDVEKVLEMFHAAAALDKCTLRLIGDGEFAEQKSYRRADAE